jgi:hypothetical protein
LARNTKLTDDLVGFLEAGKMLQWIAALVSRIPVYKLEVPWGVQELPQIAAHILSWHDSSKSGNADAEHQEQV